MSIPSTTFKIDKTSIAWIARTILIVLFLYSGWSKIIGWRNFTISLARSPLIGQEILWFVAYGIPILELLSVLLLISNRTKSFGFSLCFFLLATFSFYLVAMVVLFTKLPCACGGIFDGMSYPVHIAFNIFFTLVAVVGIYTHKEKLTAEE